MTKKHAVVLLNLGGPDSLDSVEPFLFNLFRDEAIINLPNPFRWLVAKLISRKRTPIAKEIYSKIGGKSPILEFTRNQAEELERILPDSKVFIAMRYWHPFSFEVISEIEKYDPDEILLLPLYPQFSTTTTGSSIRDFEENLQKSKLKNVKMKAIGCYFFDEKFIEAHVKLIRGSLEGQEEKLMILFSAHGLPEKIIKKGDPYQWQIEETVAKIMKNFEEENLEYKISYQSRVGPLKWIGPNTEDEIILAGKQRKSLLVVPISFVSEHSETLVELDLEYAELAKESGVKSFSRVPVLACEEMFMESLKNACLMSFGSDFPKVASADGEVKCSDEFLECVCRKYERRKING